VIVFVTNEFVDNVPLFVIDPDASAPEIHVPVVNCPLFVIDDEFNVAVVNVPLFVAVEEFNIAVVNCPLFIIDDDDNDPVVNWPLFDMDPEVKSPGVVIDPEDKLPLFTILVLDSLSESVKFVPVQFVDIDNGD